MSETPDQIRARKWAELAAQDGLAVLTDEQVQFLKDKHYEFLKEMQGGHWDIEDHRTRDQFHIWSINVDALRQFFINVPEDLG